MVEPAKVKHAATVEGIGFRVPPSRMCESLSWYWLNFNRPAGAQNRSCACLLFGHAEKLGVEKFLKNVLCHGFKGAARCGSLST
jgi:hypothetical protein